jgi:AraC family transcriptional regulator of adaptative response / DNA-3-methyladenine glycosylase II
MPDSAGRVRRKTVDDAEERRVGFYEQLAGRVDACPFGFRSAKELAASAAVDEQALDELFREHAHESAEAFLIRAQIENLCTSLAAGQEPNGRLSTKLQERFLAATGLTPAGYAGLGKEFRLRLPTAYRVREVLDFYERDPMSVSESVSGDGLRKCVLIDERAALLDIRFGGEYADCSVDAADIFAAHRAIIRILGLGADAAGFERQFRADELLGSTIARQQGLRIPLTPQPWEALAWAIMGQQISLKAAVALRRELIMHAGDAHPSGLRAHPSAEAVAGLNVETLRRLKFSRSKAEYLLAAARAVASGELPLATMRKMSARRAARLLSAIRGVGRWTVQYVFLRGLGFADCLPAGDAGLAQGLGRLCGERPGELQIRELMARFAPYRSLATCHVWATLKGRADDAN